ncbi:MAG: acyl-CoA dehydratase activase [Dehalococcoidales bacterium]|nr:acyl-CoA dehydratase activase [Dehalococcoidales bacterium]
MIFAGVDIGSRAAKAVVMEDDRIIATAIIDTGPESVKTAHAVMEKALSGSGLALRDITYTVATGYGRVLVPFASENVSEISCHARGINWYFPSVRTVLDMGGQDCKAINCDGSGRVTNFVMNDKCAGGTGRFLEMIADVLNVPLAESGELALKSRNAVPFNTVCAVFAKSDAIAYLRKGVAKADILAGLYEAIAQRSLNLLKRVSIEKDFAITGGISKNRGMVRKLAEKVGLEPLLCDDPQLCGALGAALFARERYEGGRPSAMKVQYGYADGTGEYFITIDHALCNGCGECVAGCPAGVFAVQTDGTSAPRAVVKEELRRRLAMVCPGAIACSAKHGKNCLSACKVGAIRHSW